MTMALLILQVTLGAALAWSCFCRLVRTDGNTAREIRWAIVFEAGAAMMVAGAPFIPIMLNNEWWPILTTPWWVWVVLLMAAAAVQVATARYWRGGVPQDFQRMVR